MTKKFILFISLWMITSSIYAANPYKLGEVDFFFGESQAKPVEEKKVFDWRESSRTTDGKTIDYVPPVPILKLLQDPTPENARAYIDWQRQKVEKIIKAQQVVDQVLKEDTQS